MEKTTSKKSKARIQLMIAVMIMTALFLAELYVMINESANIILLLGIAVLILIAVYFVIDAVLDYISEKAISNREQYDTIYRAEKASYLLLKKNLEAFSKQIKAGDSGKGDVSTAKIIKSQKLIAKAIMDRNRETQDKLFVEMNNLEASLKDSIHGLSEKLFGFQEEIELLADHIAKINNEAINEVIKHHRETKKAVEENTGTVDDKPTGTTAGGRAKSGLNGMNTLSADSLREIDSKADSFDFEGLDLDNLMVDTLSDEDILSRLAGEVSEEPSKEPTVEDIFAKESVKLPEPGVYPFEELIKPVDETPIAEPAPAKDMSDPNKMMTPEEIAALIANM